MKEKKMEPAPTPYISDTEREAHKGETYIAYGGKVLSWGTNAQELLEGARKVMPDIDQKIFLIGHVWPKNMF